jgi:hypothetical protein
MIKSLTVVVALAIPTLAAAATTGIVLDNNTPIATVQMPSQPYARSFANKSKLPAIYENFATLYPKGEYNAVEGAALSGIHTLHGQIWLAQAFTPKAAVTIGEIDVAASLIGGEKNVVAVHLYADDSGVPGTELWSQNTKLPTFGGCCAVVALNMQVPVQAGHQYWVGITTLGGPASTVSAAWNLAVRDQVNPSTAAQNRGNGWVPGASIPAFAIGIYGQ